MTDTRHEVTLEEQIKASTECAAYAMRRGSHMQPMHEAILASLVSLRDAGKELPGEPWFLTPDADGEMVEAYGGRNHYDAYVKLKDYDALHKIAVADRARVRELEEEVQRVERNANEIADNADTLLRLNQKLLVASESRVRELEAEREAMMAKLRRYRNEVPLGHQPHMLTHEVDELLKAAAMGVE